jgi:glycosyltransferase involved in cell wall biosynthesis
MRVLFVTNTFPPAYTGGAEVANYHTVRGLIRRGITCEILFINNRMPRTAEDWYALDDIPVHRIDFFTRRRTTLNEVFDGRIYRALRAELKRFKPDVVHMQNMSGATLAPYVACRAAGVPVINTLHDHWLLCPNNMLLRADGGLCDPRGDHRQCFRRYDFWGNVPRRLAVFSALTANVQRFISPSQALIDRHVAAGYARERFRLVRLGFEPARPQAVLHPGVQRIIAGARQHRVVTFAGGGVEIKGARVVLAALPQLAASIDQLQLVVAGHGEQPLLDAFKQFEPATTVLGWVPFNEMQALFAASELVLLPSTCHENSPVVIYQSYQMGTPVAGSQIGGIPELIEPDCTGTLFPANDPVALADSVAAHLARPAAERRRMRQHCVQRARTELTLERHLDQHLAIYREVVDAR